MQIFQINLYTRFPKCYYLDIFFWLPTAILLTNMQLLSYNYVITKTTDKEIVTEVRSSPFNGVLDLWLCQASNGICISYHSESLLHLKF